MAHIPHSEIDFIENDLLEQQEVIEYLIGMETSNTVGEHMHFICCVNSETWYHKWSKRIFKDKYKLKGKAYKIDGNGYPRQYGKLKEIKDFEKMGSYTVKDGNIRTNMSQNVIDNFVEKSHKKNILHTMTYEICEKMAIFDKSIWDTYVALKKIDRQRNPLTEDEKLRNRCNPNYNPYADFQEFRKSELIIYIIKQLKEKNVESISKGKIDSVWNRFITLHFTPEEIFNEHYRMRRLR